MKSIISTLLIIFSFIANSFGQDEPTISTVDGIQNICIKEDFHVLKVKINLPIGYDITKVDSFTIRWSYPISSEYRKITITNTNELGPYDLQFYLPGIYSNCQVEQEGIVRLDTYENDKVDPKNNMFIPAFRVPPTAKISDDSLTTCVGQPFTFDGSKSCPTNITEYEWTIEGKKYYGRTYTHTFATSGKKTITLKVTNRCDSHTDEIEIIVRPLPEAIAEANAKMVANKYVICLNDNEKGKILLDGSKSKFSNNYEWSAISGGSVSFSDERVLGILIKEKKWAHFTATGIYTIVLKVNLPCNYPDYDTIKVEVIDKIPVYLNPISDTCGPIQYSPPTNVSGTVYTINGVQVSVFPKELKTGNYTIKATYQNDCGLTSDEITFKVFEPQIAKILAPANGTIVCKNNQVEIELVGNYSAGVFSGNNVKLKGGKYYFVPSQVGKQNILFTTGTGECMRNDNIVIEVIDNTPLTLTRQSNVCNSLSYTPGNYNNAAQYKINGKVEKNFPKILGAGIYIVEAALSNACASYLIRDTFEVSVPQNVTIISPLKDTTVCNSNIPFELKGSAENGAFTGSSYISKNGKKWIFTPSQSGTYIITFSVGIDACKSSQSVKITVVENQVPGPTIYDKICFGQSYQLPNGTTANASGVYSVILQSSSGCDSIIKINLTVLPKLEKPIISQSGIVLSSNYKNGNQWYFNGVAVNGENQQDIKINKIGVYSVLYTDANGCKSMSNELEILTVNIHEKQVGIETFRIYPNPSEGFFNIEIEFLNTSDITLEIVNILGQVVFSKKMKNINGKSIIQADLSKEGKGVYLVNLYYKNEVINRRVIVQ